MSFSERVADGLYNALSGLGTSRDKGATGNQYIAAPSLLTWVDLDNLVRDNHFARRIVSHLPGECIRRGWKIVTGDPTLDKEIDDTCASIGLSTVLAEAHRLARTYSGAGVLIGVNDGLKLNQPVGRPASVDYLIALDGMEIYPGFREDAIGPYWDQPKDYQLAASGNVDPSRVIPFLGHPVSRRSQTITTWRADAVLQVVWSALANFGMVELGCANIIQEFSTAFLSMKGLAQVVDGPDGSTKLAQRLAAINLSKSMVNMVCLDADNESYRRETISTAGIADLWDRFSRTLAAAAEMSIQELFGEAPGGLSTDDKSGRTYSYDRTSAVQTQVYEPAIRRVVDLILRSKGIRKLYAVVFTPLTEPTEAEKAATEKVKADTQAVQIQSEILSVDEVRESLGLKARIEL